MSGRALSVFGNAVVFAVLAFGAWLWWRNVTSTADPPPAAVAMLSETAGRAGIDPAAGAPRVASRLPPGSLTFAASGLVVPVAGIEAPDLVDTYTQSRGGGSRIHNAIDIMASRGTPVVSASDGLVEKLYFSRGGGGITAYVRSLDGLWLHYYAHLDSYAPGLREGQRIRRGDQIGTVGISGNASPSGPHLHYAIYRMRPGERWWQGAPINPYPLLAGKTASR
ncbi:peptidoglycan DD-metalloendopeptidase family protein [Sphingomonas sp. LHG3406-1]|uniref:M23 family metallopeptidase n=1 Tax=Sphingomonas sp. LHG3406-1 TaxID=2804617 RepID=UPI0026341526|nr:peptidoglycan DD-metalloendopeptidase family protein [Sphingomonas sp. LHG3406-1]